MTREGRLLLLVAHLERSGFDLNRLVAGLRETLHGVRYALRRALCVSFAAQDSRDDEEGAPGTANDQLCPIAEGREHHFGLPEGPGAGVAPGAGASPGSSPPPCWPPDDWNRPCTRPLSDSTRDTPVVMSTSSRSPRSTFLPWVSTTPPSMVTRLVLVSNTAVSPVTT